MSYKEELKEMISSFRAEYEKLCSESRNAYMDTLPAGSKMPPAGVLYGDAFKNAFQEKCDAYRQQAAAIIHLERKTIEDEYAEAPSTEAMNAVAVISARTDLTEREVSAIMERYGGNRLAAAAISNAAKNSGLRVFSSVPSLDALLSDLDRIEGDLRDKFSTSGMARGKGHDSLLAYLIDSLGNGDAYKAPARIEFDTRPVLS